MRSRRKFTKPERKLVYNKTHGKCAICGNDITFNKRRYKLYKQLTASLPYLQSNQAGYLATGTYGEDMGNIYF